MMLRLSDAGRLPTLANHCFIVGEAKRADVIWSEGDFKTLCEHMLNENPLSHFLNVWIDANGKAQFTKAPVWSRADRRASWAWATIIGKAKGPTGIGFYPSNPERQSRWAALDFDARNGQHEQARQWSLQAFSLLLQNPQLHLILGRHGEQSSDPGEIWEFNARLYSRECWSIRFLRISSLTGRTRSGL